MFWIWINEDSQLVSGSNIVPDGLCAICGYELREQSPPYVLKLCTETFPINCSERIQVGSKHQRRQIKNDTLAEGSIYLINLNYKIWYEETLSAQRLLQSSTRFILYGIPFQQSGKQQHY